MEGALESEESYPVEREYARSVDALKRAGILALLSKSESLGVIGGDGKEYPLPSQDQMNALFADNRELVSRKVSQGFDHLELTPMAMPVLLLLDRMNAAIIKHAMEGEIYQTRRHPSDPLIAARVNSEQQVWIWNTLRQAIDAEELVYFPQEYSLNHQGRSKLEVVNTGQICAIPGWSVGLVECLPIMPQPGQGMTLGGRKQLEIGSSPREYLRTLQTPAYQGETGETVEEFATRFLIRLGTANEVSNDRYDNNALWLLGHYVKYVEQVRSDLVPTGWWHREYGRARLDAHRPGNRQCTRSWGVSTTVRLRSI
jgi:hypothetical protein